MSQTHGNTAYPINNYVSVVYFVMDVPLSVVSEFKSENAHQPLKWLAIPVRCRWHHLRNFSTNTIANRNCYCMIARLEPWKPQAITS